MVLRRRPANAAGIRDARQTFRTLMATRASGLAPDHVRALNMIDVEFYGKDRSSRAVLEAWKAYLDHLNMSDSASEGWGAKGQDLLVDMLQKMASHLGFEFDRTDIRRTSYFPRGYGEAEFELFEMRKLLLAILRGERGLPVYVPPPGEQIPIEETSGGAAALPPGEAPR